MIVIFILGVLVGMMIGKYIDMAAKYGLMWFKE